MSEVVTGTNRPSYQIRRPTENDEERLAKRKGGVPPPLPRRIDNPRIREDPKLLEFFSISDKIHRATSEDIFAQAWSNNSQSIFPQSWKKIGANVELFHMSTYQCSILLKNMGYGKVNSENHKNLNKPIAQNERYNITNLSLLREFWWK